MKIRIPSKGLIARALVTAVVATLPFAARAQSPCLPDNAGPGCGSAIFKSSQVSPTPTTGPAASFWAAKRDASLRELLAQWSARAGWQEPTWNLNPEDDFTLGASMDFEGDFAGAVTALFDAFPAEAKLRVRLYTSNRLMIVEQAP